MQLSSCAALKVSSPKIKFFLRNAWFLPDTYGIEGSLAMPPEQLIASALQSGVKGFCSRPLLPIGRRICFIHLKPASRGEIPAGIFTCSFFPVELVRSLHR